MMQGYCFGIPRKMNSSCKIAPDANWTTKMNSSCKIATDARVLLIFSFSLVPLFGSGRGEEKILMNISRLLQLHQKEKRNGETEEKFT